MDNQRNPDLKHIIDEEFQDYLTNGDSNGVCKK